MRQTVSKLQKVIGVVRISDTVVVVALSDYTDQTCKYLSLDNDDNDHDFDNDNKKMAMIQFYTNLFWKLIHAKLSADTNHILIT